MEIKHLSLFIQPKALGVQDRHRARIDCNKMSHKPKFISFLIDNNLETK